jgi:hypothetical membrane protein
VASSVALVLAVGAALALDRTVRALPVRARLSDLGRPGAPGALVFDSGLILAGLLGFALAVGLWRVADGADDPGGRAVAALAGAAFLGVAGAGAFPAPTTPHAPLLALAYVGGLATVLADGARRRDARPGRAGSLLVAAVVGVAALWGIRAVVGATFLLAGTGALLLAELATLATLAAWTAYRARIGDGPGDRRRAAITGDGR